METRLKLSDPSALEATLSVRMTVREWRSVYKAMDTASNTTHEFYSLRSAMRNLIERAEKELWGKDEAGAS